MIELKPAQMENFDFYYNLKCDDFNKYWSGFPDNPEREKLFEFFENTIINANDKQARKLFIIFDDDIPIGELSIKPNGEEFDMPFSLDEGRRGNGNGYHAFNMGLEKAKELGLKRLVGKVREDNIASRFNLKKCGATVSKDYETIYEPTLGKEIKMYNVYKDLCN